METKTQYIIKRKDGLYAYADPVFGICFTPDITEAKPFDSMTEGSIYLLQNGIIESVVIPA